MKSISQEYTAQKKKAVTAGMKEFYAQIAEKNAEFNTLNTAMMLYALHKSEGYGKKRLIRFYARFAPMFQMLQDFYSARAEGELDKEFIAKELLKKECGIDVDELPAMVNFEFRVKSKGETK